MGPRSARLALAILVAVFIVAVALAIAASNALGYDEAVYALRARSWISHAPDTGWGLHRPPLLSVLGVPAAALGGAEWLFRVVGLGSGVALIAAAWWLARAAGGELAGLVAAAALVAAAPLHVQSSTFLTDVPSTAVLVLLAGGIWRQIGRGEPTGRGLAGLALLAAAAFYLRYGAIVPIAGLATAAAVVAPRTWWSARRQVGLGVAAFLAFLLPHLVVATIGIGAPWSILAFAQSAAGRGERLPLLDYLGWFPGQLLGPMAAVVIVIGLATAALAATGRLQLPGTPRFAAFALVASAVPIGVLGTTVHAEPRYVMFPMVLLVVAGSVAIGPVLARQRRIAAPAAVLAGVAAVHGIGMAQAEIGTRTALYDWKREAGLIVRSGAGECSVLAADVAIMTWYSRCPAHPLLVAEGHPLAALSGEDRWVLLADAGPHQPPAEVIADDLLPHLAPMRRLVDGRGLPVATLYRIAPGSPYAP